MPAAVSPAFDSSFVRRDSGRIAGLARECGPQLGPSTGSDVRSRPWRALYVASRYLAVQIRLVRGRRVLVDRPPSSESASSSSRG